MKTFIFTLTILTFFSAFAVAKTITVNASDGAVQITLPDEVADMALANLDQINQALSDNNVTMASVTLTATQITNAYSNLSQNMSSPITTTSSALNSFTGTMVDVLPNSQLQSNVWAKAWIGKLLHMGFGVNTGVTSLDIEPLKNAAEQLEVDVSDIPGTLPFPTVAADVRIGGFILPFDLGLSFFSIDTSKLGEMLDPVAIDYTTFGLDMRYCFIRHGPIKSKVSASLGYYYTKGSINVAEDDTDVGLSFKSSTIVPGIQGSAQVLCFVPFIGLKMPMSSSSANWHVKADWNKILDNPAGDLQGYAAGGLLPSLYKGSSKSNYFNHIRPVLYGGLGLDLFILDLTLSGSYDIIEKIPAAALSCRIAW